MKIAIISGSQRPNSESERIGRYFSYRIQQLLQAETYELHLGQTPLPLWDDEFPDRRGENWNIWSNEVKPELDSSDGFVIITPEWAGMATPAIKNFILLSTNFELAHKPALLTAVSNGRGGAFPIAELRQSSCKNTQICYIPEHLIIRNSTAQFQKRDINLKATEEQVYIEKRVDFALDLLGAYANALKSLRENHAKLIKTFTFGMS